MNRLRDVLSAVRVLSCAGAGFDFAHSRGAAALLTGYQTPAAIRRIGAARLSSWLARQKVHTAGNIADTAVAAAKTQVRNIVRAGRDNLTIR